ncbi:11118_t:CDS:2, partial [Dentiscutata heterogama]
SMEKMIELAADKLLVNFGAEILKLIKGRVSVEVDARLSFDTNATIIKSRHLISLFEEIGIDKSRVMIKIASTWEGIQAAKILEKEGIQCNMTLIFSFVQAVACAEVGATIISPYAGRILDWYTKNTNKTYKSSEDPGEIEELAGCDFLTIGPKLLNQLQNTYKKIERKLSPDTAYHCLESKTSYDEKAFKWQLNEDAMTTEKLAEGIRQFAKDSKTLMSMLRQRLINETAMVNDSIELFVQPFQENLEETIEYARRTEVEECYEKREKGNDTSLQPPTYVN